MRVHHRGLNKGETLVASRHSFKVFDLDYLSLAGLGRHFHLEERRWKPPTVDGKVVLSASVSEGVDASVCLYVIKENDWSNELASLFHEQVLPAISDWIREVRARPETVTSRHVESVVTMTKTGFAMVELETRFSVHESHGGSRRPKIFELSSECNRLETESE